MPRDLPLFVHSGIDDMTDITPNAMRVYMHLTRRADADGVAWPSYQAIGDHCFRSISDNPATRKSHARNAINDLIEAGLLSKHAREREDGGQTSNGYLLSTVDSPTPPVLIKHPPVLDVAPPVLNRQAPCLSGTKDTPIEEPNKDDDDKAQARGEVIKAWEKNVGMVAEHIGEKLFELVDEVGALSTIHGIHVAVESNVRTFRYVQTCARNHAAGRDSPSKSGSTSGNRSGQNSNGANRNGNHSRSNQSNHQQPESAAFTKAEWAAYLASPEREPSPY